jgi:NAD(P)-dependent dehydrogenase (short-subunit alcohol dehydrogenase family)
MDRRTALVTGGSRGIGRAIAQALHDAGHRVAVTGRDAAKLAEVRQQLDGVIAIAADVADPGQCEAVVSRVEGELGPVDILVNNAGIGGGDAGPQKFLDMDPADWWRVQEINVRGPMLYSHAVLPGMVERNFGVIVNIGSYMAIRPTGYVTAYAASKAALARFTDCMAAELAGSAVQVFCVSPGLVLTDMTRDQPFIRNVPAEAFNQPEDIAGRVCKLASGGYAALSGLFLHVGDDLEEQRDNAERIREESLYTLRLHGLEGHIP